MQTLDFSIIIEAPRTKVWDTMLEQPTYRLWTTAFMEGSYYEGSWKQGSKIRFLAPSGDGMVSEIAENLPHEFISICHLGYIKDGVEDTTSEAVRGWAPSFENYTFREAGKGTELHVTMDVMDEHADMMQKMWPKALNLLKSLCEDKA